MNDLANWVQDALIVLLFIFSAIGAVIAYEIRALHKRIDSHSEKLESHVKEGVTVHRSLERIETKLDMHMKNGGGH